MHQAGKPKTLMQQAIASDPYVGCNRWNIPIDVYTSRRHQLNKRARCSHSVNGYLRLSAVRSQSRSLTFNEDQQHFHASFSNSDLVIGE